VLIVEDEVMIHLLFSDVLEERGVKAVFAVDAIQAINALDAPGAEFRVLVTDINLGRGQLTGWDVARRARDLVPALPVVYMTGDCAGEWATHAVESSVLLTKPFGIGHAVDVIVQLAGAPGVSVD
jgi:CheY-like chemotaxis protein